MQASSGTTKRKQEMIKTTHIGPTLGRSGMMLSGSWAPCIPTNPSCATMNDRTSQTSSIVHSTVLRPSQPRRCHRRSVLGSIHGGQPSAIPSTFAVMLARSTVAHCRSLDGLTLRWRTLCSSSLAVLFQAMSPATQATVKRVALRCWASQWQPNQRPANSQPSNSENIILGSGWNASSSFGPSMASTATAWWTQSRTSRCRTGSTASGTSTSESWIASIRR
mmetsp:Transcript_14057/g.38630  ORF Transcript_14057/g.38630 Transcript_14057/m.38630 type:complete len:221 (+) Transcript_14057:467-1129(+)